VTTPPDIVEQIDDTLADWQGSYDACRYSADPDELARREAQADRELAAIARRAKARTFPAPVAARDASPFDRTPLMGTLQARLRDPDPEVRAQAEAEYEQFRAILGQAVEQIKTTLAEIARVWTAVFKGVARQVAHTAQRFQSVHAAQLQARGVSVMPQDNPMQRALWLKQHRDHGPQGQPFLRSVRS
jgi:hypothetical protein